MKRRSISYISLSFFILVMLSGLLIFPESTTNSAKNALNLCFETVVPTLFPFFVISRLFTSLRLSDILCKTFRKIMPFFFSVNGNLASAFIIGFCGGYPTGAVTVSELYTKKLCTKREAERALAFCNNTGPAFIIGAVGTGLLGNTKAGIVLFLIHFLSALLVGISFRIFSPMIPEPVAKDLKNTQIPKFSFAFTDAIFSSVNAILSISGYIVFFSVLVSLLSEMKILPALSVILSKFSGLGETPSKALLSGIFEITSGINSLVKYNNFTVVFTISAALVSFGGMSVHAQTLSFISNEKFRMKEYFCGKILQGIFSAILAFFFSRRVISLPHTINTFLTETPASIPLSVFPFFILVIIIIYFFCKKGWKNKKI